jgi:hypothetical protein
MVRLVGCRTPSSGKRKERKMKQTSQIGPVVAAAILALGLVAPVGTAAAADATKPTYNGAAPRSTDSSSGDYHANSNGNDYHANYHADYSATQDGRPSQPPKAGEQPDPRADDRRFQDGDRYSRYPLGYRR